MVLYWILFFLLLLAVIFFEDNRTVFCFLSAILFFVGFTRSSTVGVDLESYSMLFDMVSTRDYNFGYVDGIEVGFAYLMASYKIYISSDPMSFFRFIFFVNFLLIFLAIDKISSKKVLSLFIYYSLSYYFFSFNGIRQAFCFSIIFYSFSRFITSPKAKFDFVLYILITLFSSLLLHKSQLIMLIVPLFYIKKDSVFLSIKTLFGVLFLCTFFSMFFSKLLFEKLPFINNYISLSEKYSGYVESLHVDDKFSYLSNILHGIFALLLLFFSRKNNNIYMQIFCLGTVILVLLSPLNWLFIRLSDTYTIFIIIVIPIIWASLSDAYEKTFFKSAVIIYCLVLFANRLSDDKYLDVVPYVNILFD